MNSKKIKEHLNKKIEKWIDSVQDKNVKKTIKENVIVTGGAIVSLLTGEEVNDYDIYFRTKESLILVVSYYINKWKKDGQPDVTIETNVDERVILKIPNGGILTRDISKIEENSFDIACITGNAITLTDDIQIVTRFYGEVEEIHKNYDFIHCTCCWTSWDDELILPYKALECIINKELYYVGSKYPLCSIIRARKYIERGYHINAGQYLKMCLQLNEMDLLDVETLQDQLVGADSKYFNMLIKDVKLAKEKGENIDNNYLIDLINKLF